MKAKAPNIKQILEGEEKNNIFSPGRIFEENNLVSLSKRKNLVKDLQKKGKILFQNQEYKGTAEQNYILAFSIKNNKSSMQDLSNWKINETVEEYSPYIKGKLSLLQNDIDHFSYSDYKEGLESIKLITTTQPNFVKDILKTINQNSTIEKLKNVDKNISIKELEKLFKTNKKNKTEIKNNEVTDFFENNKVIKELLSNLIENLKLETDKNKITEREFIGIFGKTIIQFKKQLKKNIEKSNN